MTNTDITAAIESNTLTQTAIAQIAAGADPHEVRDQLADYFLFTAREPRSEAAVRDCLWRLIRV